MANMLRVVAVLSVFLCSAIAQDAALLARYQNFTVLSTSPQYELYWTPFSDSINFAVRVSTTGWIGFGISPTGLMLDSDVIMGFVDDATNQPTLVVSRSRARTVKLLLKFVHLSSLPPLPLSTFCGVLYCQSIITVFYIHHISQK